MAVFDFTDYKTFVGEVIKAKPKGGYGQWRKVAEHLRVSTTFVSQVFGGAKDLTVEQAVALAQFLELSPLETDYFTALVELQRAGSHPLKALITNRLNGLRERANELVNRLRQDKKELTDAERARFYSSWYYSGIRLLTSLPDIQSSEQIAAHLRLPPGIVERVLDFLLSTGLVVQDGQKFAMGPSHIHLGASSEFVAGHHRNWRTKAMSRLDDLRKDELAFSAPMTVSRQDAVQIRKELVGLIERVCAIAEPSPAEKLACLNIDWFDL